MCTFLRPGPERLIFLSWAKFGYGNTITQYELGVGYELAKNWEANVFYNDTKYKDFSHVKTGVLARYQKMVSMI